MNDQKNPVYTHVELEQMMNYSNSIGGAARDSFRPSLCLCFDGLVC